jgi:hypothetical protein
MLTDRIALGLLVALVGDAAWLRELPKRRRRDPRDLRWMVRLWADLAQYARALTAVVQVASDVAQAPSNAIHGPWLRLAHATVAVADASDPGMSSRILDVLGSLPEGISALGPQGNIEAFLSNAAADVTAIRTGVEPQAIEMWSASAGSELNEWSGTVTLYHGTTDRDAESIRSEGIQLAVQQRRTDFGTGFYTTPDHWDARRMARRRAQARGGAPVVMRFDVPAERLNEMSGMTFPGPSQEYQDFVRMMRNTQGLRHTFDWVSGPVLYGVRDFRLGGEFTASGAQVSFHTSRAVQLLTAHLVDERGVRRAGSNGFDCPCGENHWGIDGAAGLLPWYRDSVGADWFLLQERGSGDYAGTWGLLGGAREPNETRSRRPSGRPGRRPVSIRPPSPSSTLSWTTTVAGGSPRCSPGPVPGTSRSVWAGRPAGSPGSPATRSPPSTCTPVSPRPGTT